VNLGFALSIWDQLAHRALFPSAATIRADTGLAGRPLVVEQQADRSRHLAIFMAQLVAPFRPMDDEVLPSIRADRARGHGCRRATRASANFAISPTTSVPEGVMQR
jgi:hypothetical protein